MITPEQLEQDLFLMAFFVGPFYLACAVIAIYKIIEDYRKS